MSQGIKFTKIDLTGVPMELPDFYCKYTPVKIVQRQGNALVNFLIENAPRVGRRFTTVDVKVQALEVGNTTCIPGWHCDTISDPDAMHSLFVLGDNRTQFMTIYGVASLPEDMFAQYGSDQKHRGPVVTIPEIRFLFRLTESDSLRGTSKIHAEYPYTFA